jgi:hypothetical protein
MQVRNSAASTNGSKKSEKSNDAGRLPRLSRTFLGRGPHFNSAAEEAPYMASESCSFISIDGLSCFGFFVFMSLSFHAIS